MIDGVPPEQPAPVSPSEWPLPLPCRSQDRQYEATGTCGTTACPNCFPSEYAERAAEVITRLLSALSASEAENANLLRANRDTMDWFNNLKSDYDALRETALTVDQARVLINAMLSRSARPWPELMDKLCRIGEVPVEAREERRGNDACAECGGTDGGHYVKCSRAF